MADEELPATELRTFGVSKDGKFARLELSDTADGSGKVVLTMPVDGLPAFHDGIGELLDRLRERGVVPSKKAVKQTRGGLHQPKAWLVGTSDNPQLKAFTALQFDQKTVNEVTMVMADIDALALADAIVNNVHRKMSPAERAEMERQKRAAASKVILPGDPRFN